VSTGNKTNFAEMIGELNAGVFEQQVNQAISDVALGVVTQGKAGEVTIKLSLKQIGEGNQVSVTHKLSYVKPTMRGRLSEEAATDTPMHVGAGGVVSLYPNKQTSMELGAGAATGRTDGVRA